MPRIEDRAFYASRQWKALRRYRLHLDSGLCQKCKARGIVEPATEVDHVLPVISHPHLRYQIENLQSLCSSCHSKKTAADKNGRPRYCAHGFREGSGVGCCSMTA